MKLNEPEPQLLVADGPGSKLTPEVLDDYCEKFKEKMFDFYNLKPPGPTIKPAEADIIYQMKDMLVTKHKDDKGEFEYVPAQIEDLNKLAPELYKKVYLDKQIDWSKVDSTVLVKRTSRIPRDVSARYLGDMTDNFSGLLTFDTDYLHANPGHCPLPEGVMVEVTLRECSTRTGGSEIFKWEIEGGNAGDIITYRITGLADGWKY